ncbi:MAG: TAXI family TRAP transporter solute-binding subunit [Spirochaetales bacterium]|jgi:TRAP transporter TAXI family solute receptor|nr:TAXI family TRAP transporter solute-binding subunit [Spirochaetales bacterium]
MKKKVVAILLLVLILPAFVFAGGGKESAGAAGSSSPVTITVGTSGPGSVAFTWVSTLSTLLEQEKADVRIRVAGDMPDVEAFRIMEKAAAGVDASLGTGTTLARALSAKEPFKPDETFKNLRVLFPLGLSPVQTVARQDSGITKFSDFNGKRISGGAVGSGPDTFMREFFPKMYPNIKVEIVPMAFSGVSSAMQDKKIDGYLTFGSAPYPAIVETQSLVKINFIDIEDDVRTRWFKEHPEHHTMKIAAGSYETQTKEIVSLGHVAHLVTNTNLSEQVAYYLTKRILDPKFKESLIKATAAWAAAFEGLENNTFFDDVKGLGLRLHPGAARAYEEAGYDVSGIK